jgi:hypothetical protein
VTDGSGGANTCTDFSYNIISRAYRRAAGAPASMAVIMSPGNEVDMLKVHVFRWADFAYLHAWRMMDELGGGMTRMDTARYGNMRSPRPCIVPTSSYSTSSVQQSTRSALDSSYL